MISIATREDIAHMAVVRSCFHCDNPIEIGAKAASYRGTYIDKAGIAHSTNRLFCHVECADAGEDFNRTHRPPTWTWLSEITDHNTMGWVIQHHPAAADNAEMPQRLMKAAMGGGSV